MSSQTCISINFCTELVRQSFSSKYSLEPKNFLRGFCPLNPLLRGSDIPAPLTLGTLPFPLIMFPAGSYNIHPEHNKMASD